MASSVFTVSRRAPSHQRDAPAPAAPPGAEFQSALYRKVHAQLFLNLTEDGCSLNYDVEDDEGRTFIKIYTEIMNLNVSRNMWNTERYNPTPCQDYDVFFRVLLKSAMRFYHDCFIMHTKGTSIADEIEKRDSRVNDYSLLIDKVVDHIKMHWSKELIMDVTSPCYASWDIAMIPPISCRRNHCNAPRHSKDSQCMAPKPPRFTRATSTTPASTVNRSPSCTATPAT